MPGKRKRKDVARFSLNLTENLFDLHLSLKNKTYRHGGYVVFKVNDPKSRKIHKASVRDRLIHHAICRVLTLLFDKTFIFDCYSCRKGKGTHKAFARLVLMARKQCRNYTRTCWALKCDIRKFFHSVDHQILLELLAKRIDDEKLITLLEEIIRSFETLPSKGMPLGNLTSQLFANVYLDPLDKFIKHKLKAKYYLRYADDFMILADSKVVLQNYLVEIEKFLNEKLKLSLHPDKVTFRKLAWGLDFVGYVAHPKFNLPRKKTVERMFTELEKIRSTNPDKLNESLQSYLGYLKHVNSKAIMDRLRERFYS